MDGDAPLAPQVFTRTFSVPPGLPWDQARAARLEVRHGAPLPIGDLLHRVRRLTPWSSGSSGRYAVFYIRRRDYVAPFETVLDVDGTAVRIAFGSTPAVGDVRRLQGAALAGVVVAALAALALGPLTVALQVRASAEERLALLETRTAARDHQLARIEQQRKLSLALARAQGRSGLAGDVVADLAWAGQAKTANARILAIHWDHGVMAIEARGETPPVTPLGRRIVKADKPLRPGVSLWGVDRAGSGAAAGFGP